MSSLPRARTMLALAALALASSGAGACTCSSRSSGDAPGAGPSGVAVPLAASARPDDKGDKAPRVLPKALIDFVAGFDACTLSHRGVLLDLGDATMRARMSGGKVSALGPEIREHEGATWASLSERGLELAFVSPAEIKPEGGVVVEARARGGAAKSLSVFLNGKPVGVLPLTKGEAKVVSIRTTSGGVARGANELLLRATGGAKASHDQLVEIDWIRVGAADGDAPYAAPTRADALTTVSIGGVARRGISLRAPGSARCPGFVPNGAVLEGQLGVTGGEAEAEVRVLVDRAEPRVVGSYRLGGEGSPPWRPISLPLGDVGGLAAVELVAKTSTKGARVVFAEPRLVASSRAAEEPKPIAKARGVIVVVLGATGPKSLSLYGGATATSELAQLATAGTVFEAHRASTSFASGALASMLTGLSPREHGISEPESALGGSRVTVPEAARQAGVVTAMFTANPTTGATFGFARGWETFVARSPTEEAAATAIFEDVERWLDAHKQDRYLVVVHARGGHPPWDVTSDELKELPPAGYSGNLDPKHAGEMLAKVKKTGALRLFGDADRERAFALHARSVLAHDAALGRLMAHVKSLGREADTTVIVTSDVGVDAADHAPFIDDDALDEPSLAIPLVVRVPGAAPWARVTAPTSGVDLAPTILDALGLTPPPHMRGETVWTAAERGARGIERPRVATTTTRFSARWSGFVLVGAREREAKLCNLSLEPDCVSDVRATHPLAAEIMHALVFDELAGKSEKGDAKRSPPAATAPSHPTPDAATAAALRLWGTQSTKP